MPTRHCILDAPAIALMAIALLGFLGLIGWALGQFVIDLAYMASGASS